MPETKVDFASEVRTLRTAMRAVDPGAYRGYHTDAAVRIVATKYEADWREVLKAYRAVYPFSEGALGRPFIGGERPSPEAMEICGRYLLS
jgi:hypothetical protein